MSQDLRNAHFEVNSNYKYDIETYFPASSTTVGRKVILPEYGDLNAHAEDISFSP